AATLPAVPTRRSSDLAYATPHIIRPTIDRLIRFGVLPNPGRYVVEWPESDSLGEKARSEIAKAKAEAVSAYVSIPGAELVVPPRSEEHTSELQSRENL